MALRSAIARIPRSSAIGLTTRSSSRCFSDGKGRVLSEEEKAAENVYIQKMERERLAKLKLKQKAEKEKAEAAEEKSDKKSEETHKG
ncbi:hypothetical protein J5N97_022591 [Dioscorea zingiberensis]|uniref:ATPase inhibitor n=1 Tax=Dioscorea zingiberensis TaxID=325984 RepID=A0A9D5CB79_9LILI|nr:hypothetical protein J5N97_022591 [Dioscorea zingiberensis]